MLPAPKLLFCDGFRSPDDTIVLSPNHELPLSVSICYKPHMRKWMRDKLKRRKKSPEEQSASTQPAPLQPAYFESEPQQAPPEAPVPEPVRETQVSAPESDTESP